MCKQIILCDIRAPMVKISSNKVVGDDQALLNWSRISFTGFGCTKIQICLIKNIKSKDLLVACQIFLRKALMFF